MRIAISFLFLCLPACSLAQNNKRPPKILTPEQIAIQQKIKVYDAEMNRLRSAATSAYNSEVDREKTGDCRNVTTNYDFIMCLSHEMEITDANYKAFTTALRAILALPSPNDPGPDQTGPTGQPATPATNTAAFDAAEIAWHAYATSECSAVDTLWRGGTIVNSMVGECDQRTTRARLHELNDAYDSLLRPH